MGWFFRPIGPLEPGRRLTMLQLAIGGIVVMLVWLGLRLSVGAGLAPTVLLLLDGGVIIVGWSLFLILTARPVLSALLILALAVGLVVVDRVKRAVLREPVLFADRAELVELVRHPQLYIPFAGTWPVVAGLAVAALAGLAALRLEPAAIPWSPLSLLAAAALVLVCLRGPLIPPLLRRLCALYESAAPQREPAADARKFGLLATFVMHATLARSERPARQAALRPGLAPRHLAARSIVLVQAESLFDVERLHPGLGAGILPNWHALRATAAAHGTLGVPCWGANTIRSEFAVLTGVEEPALGLDRFNPYAALARTPVAGLAWDARAAGFTTICVHPFDLSFYGRRHVLPQLGFDRLIGPEAFRDAPRTGLYVSDAALMAHVATLLGDATGRLLVFVITMAGHGPWDAGDPAEQVELPPPLAAGPEAAALARFLFRLRATDAALPLLTSALQARPGGFVLGLYGDHQPSFPAAFAQAGLTDTETDYLIWRGDAIAGPRRDLPAASLGRALLALA